MKKMINFSQKSNLDVLLIKPNIDIGNRMPPLGLGYLASALMKNGIKVDIKDCLKNNCSIKEVVEDVKERNVKCLGINVCTNEAGWAKKCAKAVKTNTSAKIIVGGPHPTGLKEKIFLDFKNIDFAVYSEGEVALPRLVRLVLQNELTQTNLENIPNLIWKRGESIIINPWRLEEDLDKIDFPAWQLINPTSYPRRPHGGFSRAFPIAPIITTRGCPFRCKFCSAFLMAGARVRQRSIKNILEELNILANNYGVKEIHIEDDNFTFNKEFVIQFCQAVADSKLKLLFSLPNGIRIDKIDEEIVANMKRAGFYSIVVGIESSSQRILRKMGKHLDLKIVRDKTSLIKKYGFILKGFFMLGYPGETKEEIESTIKFSKTLNLDRAFFSVFIPLPGTEEFNNLVKEGEINPNQLNWESFFTGDLSHLPYSPKGISKEVLSRYVSRAITSFYLRPKIMFKILRELKSFDQIIFLMDSFKKLVFRLK